MIKSSDPCENPRPKKLIYFTMQIFGNAVIFNLNMELLPFNPEWGFLEITFSLAQLQKKNIHSQTHPL